MDQSVTSVQFFIENFLPSFVPSLQNDPKKTLTILFPFEALKVYLRLRFLFFSPNRLLYSDPIVNNINVKETLSPDQLNKFQLEELDLDMVAQNKINISMCSDQIKESLKKLTDVQKYFSFARSEFDYKENPFTKTQTLKRSKKKKSLFFPFKLKVSKF